MQGQSGVMAMKLHSTLPRARKLEPYYQIQFSIIHRTPLFGGFSYLSAKDTVSVFKASLTACGFVKRISYSENTNGRSKVYL